MSNYEENEYPEERRITTMEADCICKVRLSNKRIYEVETRISVPCIYNYDWQWDGGFWHDEGWTDCDMDDAVVMNPKQFTFIHPEQEPKNLDKLEIVELIEITVNKPFVIN